MSKQQQHPGTYCKIMTFLEELEPEKARLLHVLCSDGVLNATKGRPGTTLLLPRGEAFWKKIEKLVYSSNPDDHDAASDMINACILRDVFKTPSAFISKKDDVPNALMPSQHIEVDSATGKEVVFKSGAKAIIDERFIDASHKKNLAVWRLDGDIPVTADKPASMKYINAARQTQRGAKGKLGSYQPTNSDSSNLRWQIAIAIENQYAHERITADSMKRPSGNNSLDAYCRAIFSLAYFVMDEDLNTFTEKIVPLCSWNKVTFYFLVEPHRATGAYLLDDNTIAGWWASNTHERCNANMCNAVIEKMKSVLGSGVGAAIYSNRQSIINARIKIGRALIVENASRPRNIINAITQQYAKLERFNNIGGAVNGGQISGGINNIFPESFHQFLMMNPGLKIAYDELTFVSYNMFCNIEKHGFRHDEFSNFTNDIGEVLRAGTQAERANSQTLLNNNLLKYQIIPQEMTAQIELFIKSTQFMYIPLSPKDYEYFGKNDETAPIKQSNVIFNIDKALYTQHSRIMGAPNSNNAEILSYLRRLDPRSLSPEIKEEIARLHNGS